MSIYNEKAGLTIICRGTYFIDGYPVPNKHSSHIGPKFAFYMGRTKVGRIYTDGSPELDAMCRNNGLDHIHDTSIPLVGRRQTDSLSPCNVSFLMSRGPPYFRPVSLPLCGHGLCHIALCSSISCRKGVTGKLHGNLDLVTNRYSQLRYSRSECSCSFFLLLL